MTTVPAKDYHRKKNICLVLSVSAQIIYFIAAAIGMPQNISKPFYLLLFYSGLMLTCFPVQLFSSHHLEKKYGLSKQTFLSWILDFFKAQAMGAVFFVAAGLIFYWLLDAYPNDWWWILSVVVFTFSAFFSTIFPVLILPFFFRSTPLNDPELERACQETLKRCGYPKRNFFKLHLGQKTTKANAALTGVGPTRRVLLADTLLNGYTSQEIQMVVAHEIGHDAKKHILRSIAIELAVSLTAFYVLCRVWPPDSLRELRYFPFLMLISTLFNLLGMPASHFISRAHEKEADRFALKVYPDLPVFESLMEKLSAQNMANPEPSYLEEFALYSHPSKKNRVQHAKNFLKILANS